MTMKINESLDKIEDRLEFLEEEYDNNYRTRHVWDGGDINFILEQKRNELQQLKTEKEKIEKKIKQLQIETSLISAELTPKQEK